MVADTFQMATRMALRGDLLRARRMFLELLEDPGAGVDSRWIANQLACVEAALGEVKSAFGRLNRLKNEQSLQNVTGQNTTAAVCGQAADFVGRVCDQPAHPRARAAMWQNLDMLRVFTAKGADAAQDSYDAARQRLAIVSLLFNWPSTGGGTVHTKELAENLASAGYHVQHLYACYAPWQIGQVTEPLSYHSRSLDFSEYEWASHHMINRFREALDEFTPDWVIVTDSWNSKPLLIEAARGYRTLVRIAAQESICPLNNVRLQVDAAGQVMQCDGNQLADPERCQTCVAQWGTQLSGALHQAERELCGFGTGEYIDRFQRAYADVEGVLVVNPEIAELVRPYVPAVHVIPSGFAAERFPDVVSPPPPENRPVRFLFAGLVPEFMKGFHVLREAGRLLWSQRQDFEIWATGDADGTEEPWLNMAGWQSQEQLPQLISQCDVLVFPTIAQEALGRTAVEAMGCGKPVVASRIGGLKWVVDEGHTGLLCAPGDAFDLAAKIEQLLNDPVLRAQLGQAGKAKFLQKFTWDAVLEQHYLPLLGVPVMC